MSRPILVVIMSVIICALGLLLTTTAIVGDMDVGLRIITLMGAAAFFYGCVGLWQMKKAGPVAVAIGMVCYLLFFVGIGVLNLAGAVIYIFIAGLTFVHYSSMD